MLVSYRLSGDHQKAIAIWKENTLPVYEEQLGDHPWTASVLSYIADSYKSLAAKGSEQDYIEQAERHFRKAQELRKRLLGHHQDTARSCVQLSDVLVLRGQFDEALEELDEALVIQKNDKTIFWAPTTRSRRILWAKGVMWWTNEDQILVSYTFSKPKLEVNLSGLGEQTEACIQNLGPTGISSVMQGIF